MSKCPICKGLNVLERPDGRGWMQCSHVAEILAVQRLDRAHIPAAYKDISFQSRSSVIQDFMLEGGSAMIFSKDAARKGTALTVMMIRKAVTAGMEARYISCHDLFVDARNSFRDEEGEAYFWRAYSSVALLVIDDLFSVRHSEYELDTLYRLIYGRGTKQKDILLVFAPGLNLKNLSARNPALFLKIKPFLKEVNI